MVEDTLRSAPDPLRAAALKRLGAARSLGVALGAVGFLLAGPPVQPAGGQEVGGRPAGGLTVERIFGTDELVAETVSLKWDAAGDSWTEVEPDSGGRTELWRIDAVSGRRTKLVSSAELVPPGASEPIRIEGYAFSSDGRRLLIFTNTQRVWRRRTKGEYYVFDFGTRLLFPVSRNAGWQMFAKFSPDGTRVAFVRDHDLFLKDLESGRERQLTFDGSKTILNGTTDWVYEEEFGLRDAFRWSPDGERIAYWKFDQSPVAVYPLVDVSPIYPRIAEVRYPKAGSANSRVRVGALELATGRTTWFDVGGGEDLYVPRMEWAASSREVVIQRMNRRQNRLDLLLGDAETGETFLLFSEEDDAWVRANDDLRWLRGGSRFTWTSERDGWRHLYLFDRSGRLIRQLTRGRWDVTAFYGVDEKRGRVFFAAASESPLTRSVHSVSLDGSDLRTLAGGRGTHAASFSPDYAWFVDTHSTIGTPPVVRLRRAEDGAEVRVLLDNEELRRKLDVLDLREPEFFTVAAADGTPLNGWIVKPRTFDPGHAYPLLLYVYGGPGSQTVLDVWGGRRYLWHQLLVRRGLLVASVDNRGTGARGRDFKKQVYMRLGQLEAADQLEAARQLSRQPFVDASRIGVWGWSYGGYMALMMATLGEGEIVAAVAGAPVTSWRLYDTIYTERYMRTPAENPEGYDAGAPLTYADRLHSDLLLIHGTADDNVHAQNTLRMVQALEEAGKHFRMRLYPGQRHGFEGKAIRVNLYEMMTDFLLEALAGPPPVAPPEPPVALP